MNGTKRLEKSYEVMFISSSDLSVTRDTYQRELNSRRVREIAENFDERVANEPKVSARDGRFYVFDGQHTIAARKMLNGGRDLPILCKVYTGLTEQDEVYSLRSRPAFLPRSTPAPKSGRWCSAAILMRLPLWRLRRAPACISLSISPEG